MAGGFYSPLDTPLLQSNACEKLLFSDHANFSDFMLLFCRERLQNEQSAEDGCEMYKVWKFTCWAIVQVIRSCVLLRPRCCLRRSLLKVPDWLFGTQTVCLQFPNHSPSLFREHITCAKGPHFKLSRNLSSIRNVIVSCLQMESTLTSIRLKYCTCNLCSELKTSE